MRTGLIWATALIIFGLFYAMAQHKETLRREGDTILLKLVPYDPRSFMQGDYVALNYELTQKLLDDMFADTTKLPPSSGAVIVRVNDQKVAEFIRYADGRPLAPGEHLLRYRHRNSQFEIGAESYFIPEGTGDSFNHAAYGELKVASDGSCLLVGLCDQNLQPLMPRHP